MVSPRVSGDQHSACTRSSPGVPTGWGKLVAQGEAVRGSHLALEFLQRRLDEAVIVSVFDVDLCRLYLGQERGEHVMHDLRAFSRDLPVRRMCVAHLLI